MCTFFYDGLVIPVEPGPLPSPGPKPWPFEPRPEPLPKPILPKPILPKPKSPFIRLRPRRPAPMFPDRFPGKSTPIYDVRVGHKGKPRACVTVTLSADWDGHDLRDENVGAIEHFAAWRQQHGVPMTHFVCPSYFSNGQNVAQNANQIRRGMIPGDEVAIHVHGWRSLLQQAGVLQVASFWSGGPVNNYQTPAYANAWADIGHDNPITHYTRQEITQIINRSRALLQGAGFNVSSSFRSGAWVAHRELLRGVRNAGCILDASGVPPAMTEPLNGLFTAMALNPHPLALWANNITPNSQPHVLNPIGVNLRELPCHYSLADYNTQQGIEGRMQWALGQIQHAQLDQTVYLHFGFHPETAVTLRLYQPNQPAGTVLANIPMNHLAKLEGALQTWRASGAIWGQLQFVTVEDAVQIFVP